MKILLVALLLLALAALFYLLSQSKSRQSGLPKGKVVYADNDQWQAVPSPLYDPQLKLTGKPDYVVALRNGTQVPVEVKSRMAPSEPYESHLMQLAAYCWLVERNSGSRPPYGLLHYKDKTYQVEYSEELETKLLELIDEIRQAEACPAGPGRSHQEAIRCQKCGYRNSCDENL